MNGFRQLDLHKYANDDYLTIKKCTIIQLITTARMNQWLTTSGFFLAANMGKIRYLNETLVRYRQHSGNVDGWAGKRRTTNRALGLTPGFDGYQAHALAAVRRAEVAFKIEDEFVKGCDKLEPRVSTAYRKLGVYYNQRAKMYRCAWFYERIKAILLMFSEGAYKSFPNGGLGGVAFFRDVIFSIPFSGRLWHWNRKDARS